MINDFKKYNGYTQPTNIRLVKTNQKVKFKDIATGAPYYYQDAVWVRTGPSSCMLFCGSDVNATNRFICGQGYNDEVNIVKLEEYVA